MDSSQRDIPIVEDDMGEGFKDPIEERENLLDRLQREAWKSEERFDQVAVGAFSAASATNGQAGSTHITISQGFASIITQVRKLPLCGNQGRQPWLCENLKLRPPRRINMKENRNLHEALWTDLETDEERVNFLIAGRGFETGIMAKAIQHEVAMAFQFRAEIIKEKMKNKAAGED